MAVGSRLAALFGVAGALSACAHTPASGERWVVAESAAAGVRVLLPPGDWQVAPSEAGLSAQSEAGFAVVEVDRAVENGQGEEQCSTSFAARHPELPEGLRTLVMAASGICVVVGWTGDEEELVAIADTVEVSRTEPRPAPAAARNLDVDPRELAALLRAGKFAEAYPMLARLVEADGDNMVLRVWAGQVAMNAGEEKIGEAIIHLQAALALHRQAVAEEREGLGDELLPQAMESLGIAYSKVKELDKAEAMLGELTVRFPEYGQGFYNFACVLALKGNTSGALTNLDRALVYAPELGEYARGDQDFVSLHGTPEFEAVIKRHPVR